MTTKEELNKRVYLLKEQTLYHQKHNNKQYFNLVTVTKFIDDNPVKYYSWAQDVDPEELQSFLDKEETTRKNKRKEWVKQYYETHKDYYIQYNKNRNRKKSKTN